MRLIKPALESQGLGNTRENKGGTMVYRQTGMTRGVRLQSQSLAICVLMLCAAAECCC